MTVKFRIRGNGVIVGDRRSLLTHPAVRRQLTIMRHLMKKVRGSKDD